MNKGSVSLLCTWDSPPGQPMQINDQVCRSVMVQEMSKVCHLEYGRAQKLVKRYVKTGSGLKYLGYVLGVYDNGIAQVAVKGTPELLMRENLRGSLYAPPLTNRGRCL